MSSRDEYLDFIFQLEQDLELFEKEFKGVNYWELIRSDVCRTINPSYSSNKSDQESSSLPKERILSILKSITVRNPFISGKKDLLYFGDPRRQNINGLYHEKCFEPALEKSNFDFEILEPIDYSYGSHREPQSTESKYTDFIDLFSTLSSRLFARFKHLSESETSDIEEIQTRLKTKFGNDIELDQILLREVYRFKISKLVYKIFLTLKSPSIVVYAIGGAGALPAACKEKNIPVAEVQHGYIGENHHDYSFSEDTELHYAPDYFFLWGEKWKETNPFSGDVELNVTGYPYMGLFENKDMNINKSNMALIISQPNYREKLLDFAVRLNEDTEYDVVYRLHPSENKNDYSEFSGILEIVGAEEKPLYTQFTESGCVLGVSSTALYEATYFGNFVYILDIPEAIELNSLIDNNLAKKVSDPQELQKEKLNGEINSEYFFTSNPAEKIEKVLGQILT